MVRRRRRKHSKGLATGPRLDAAASRVGGVVSTTLVTIVLATCLTLTPGRPAAADGNEAPGAPVAARSLTASGRHTCRIDDVGALFCWGGNTSGQLGLGDDAPRGDDAGDLVDDPLPVALGPGRTAVAVTAGDAHTCAIVDDATLRCWGEAQFGQIGSGAADDLGDDPGEMGSDLPPVDLGTGRTATAIAAGAQHTCAILDDATVRCWGRGDDGELGDEAGSEAIGNDGGMGDSLSAVALGTGRTAVAISAGRDHTCVLLDNATVKCWGDGTFGQLGYGNTTTRGDDFGEMGNSLPAVNLGSGRTATAIATGDQHSCALLDDATVKCWGRNQAGELGYGDQVARGDGPGEMGDALPAVDLGTGRTASAVTAAALHTCALLDDDTVTCWGFGGSGRLGHGDTNARGDGPGEMGDALPAVDLGTGRTATAVTTGGGHSCAHLDDGRIRCWGDNGDGQLGIGDTAARGDGPGEMGSDLPYANRRASFTVAVTAEQTSVVAGEDIDYTVTVTNTGGPPLTRVRVHAVDAPDCADDVVAVPVDGSTAYACSHPTTADDVPMMTNQVVASGHGHLAISGTRRTRVDAVRLRPDALIRLAAGAFAGNYTYNTTGAGQTGAGTVPNLGTATFTARIQNDGNTTEDITLLGQPTTTRYTVTYKDGPTNITAAVVAGTYTLEDMAPASTHDITIRIKARPGTPVGNRINRTLTATSTTDPLAKDTVKATVTRR